ncbi:DUF7711 family protein [Kibdelosporangium phytohabitans]|uniref:DUF7711 domain-containing protein n=1 Tax=Kibdelosporangium phytohabitans TaxID=860235 RepID=A0A0N9HSD5_9PSEU|nr:hypothetical protein [Kibdelosporangium phytohabitans]ALG06064.1 hypothetical protein AOZ06_03245 [Kibdelosporangium phytohabitans]MBE1465856.1 hypothetical protein [Kibdelosporangium phytohabitans]
MKWTKAFQHVEALATACDGARNLPLEVTGLWLHGRFLDARTDLDTVDVALTVDLPEVPWLSAPPGAAHWANATRLSRNPFTPVWRSARTPVSNHAVVRPMLVWDASDGVRADALTALREDNADSFRLDAPSPAQARERLDAELATSLAAMRSCTRAYAEQRWKPGKLEPVADQLHAVTNGYLDLLDARQASASSNQS